MRTMSVKVDSTGTLRLWITGQAVGPQLSGARAIGMAEHCRAEGFHNCLDNFTATSWLISALLVHTKSAAGSLPASARASLALHDSLANGAIRDWMVPAPIILNTCANLLKM